MASPKITDRQRRALVKNLLLQVQKLLERGEFAYVEKLRGGENHAIHGKA